ncbi:hypothetical protein AMK59_382 [Oryctes borbonicus]|uniref:Uncharacterized protein n=1 Tax=Oryctes borbonicus TaxID=1629725 RepID=A0A0T6BF02_9SCAR|nr:hypothetical protein AMK59_382 [Oryctes borbonicus]
MKFLIIAVILGAANASVIPIAGQIEQDIIPGIASETLVQGPSTKTRLLGPDGSQIAADAPGGRILPNEPALTVVAIPLVEAKAIVAEPIIAVPASVIAQPVVAVGRSLERSVASIPIANAVAEEGPIVTETIVSSDDPEGQYVPDNNEKLYDDGSYKEPATEETTEDGSYKGEQ